MFYNGIADGTVLSTVILNGSCISVARRSDGDPATVFQTALSNQVTHQLSSISLVTIDVRVGPGVSNTVYVNAVSSGASRYGGSWKSILEVTEFQE